MSLPCSRLEIGVNEPLTTYAQFASAEFQWLCARTNSVLEQKGMNNGMMLCVLLPYPHWNGIYGTLPKDHLNLSRLHRPGLLYLSYMQLHQLLNGS